MAGLRKLSILRHAAVGGSVLGIGVLGAAGVLGGGAHPERYEGWQVVVAPAGDDGVRIREIYDQDFGTHDRHGHQRIVPDDYGTPTDIEVSSPDAPDDLNVDSVPAGTRIRIGDPDTTISGQHRYVLEYTLPDARLARGLLALDLIERHEFDVGSVEIVVTGFALADARCFVGAQGSTDPCPLAADGDVYRSTFTNLVAGDGVTIDGTITGRVDVADVPAPPLPERREGTGVLGAGLGVLGLAGAIPVYVWAKRRGSNDVFAGGAADAAFGELPPPGAAAPGAGRAGVVRVSDDKLPELATTEFAPPDGIDPWEAAVLLTERFGNDAVSNYLSGLAGREIISLSEVDGDLAIGKGAKYALVSDPAEREMLDRIWQLGDPYVAKGSYDSQFAAAWTHIRQQLSRSIDARGWWIRGTPTRGSVGAGGAAAAVALCVVAPIAIGVGAAGGLGFVKAWPVAIGLALAVPAIVALCAYATMLPARSAHGSALALRAESFRRFLEASEGRHVEWAWKQGLLREYSAWAVALGAAAAWSRALNAANVPEPQIYVAPLLVHQHRSQLTSSFTAPSSSGSGGSGGFSGGSVGGGGGGGSSGSW